MRLARAWSSSRFLNFFGFRLTKYHVSQRCLFNNEKNPVGAHNYVVEDGKLEHLHTVDTDGDFRKKPKL
jgi:hypothetical protein